MSRVGSQQRILLELLAALRPHWRRDPALPARIERALRGDRRFGSRDRRLYRELIYAALRYLPWVEDLLAAEPGRAVAVMAWLAADTPSTRGFRAEAAAALPACPPTTEARAEVLGFEVGRLLPAWLHAECPEAFAPEQRDALLRRPPLWIRLQTEEPQEVLDEFTAHGWAWRATPLLEGAIALPPDVTVSATAAYRSGRIEIQDLGSQLVLASGSVAPGGRWLDACAGAGGKALQLARLLGPDGRVDAADVRPAILSELQARAARAGLGQRIRIADSAAAAPPGGYDGVLVDAPCSGSGTWRRFPHLQWTTTLERVRGEAERQTRLMDAHAARVRPGGQLVYATCSLCRSENEAVVATFLAGHPDFAPQIAGLRLWPAAHDGDGFFVAWLRRRP
jgi:16S rRNA (cytosine967-C5)-methyltransferase